MRKSVFLLSLLGLLPAYSAPVYYTFKGKVNFVPQDQGGYAAAHGIAAGSAVTYVFKVDTSWNGYNVAKGVRDTNTDISDSGTGYSANYFFDTLIVPSLFSAAIHDSTSGSYFGYQTRTVLGSLGRVSSVLQTIIGNSNHNTQVILYLPDTTSANFLPHLGDTIQATEALGDSTTFISGVTMTLIATAISNTPPASIGNSSRALALQPRIWAELQGGSLLVQNHSGRAAEARILDASGKTTRELWFGESFSVPTSSLPKGLFVLQVGSNGQTDLMRKAFPH